MPSITCSPLTSPALRTVISASSKVAFPSHHTCPPSPLTRLPHAQRKSNTPGSPRTPRHMNPNISGPPALGEYFNLEVPSPSPSRLFGPAFPPVSPSEIAMHTPASSILDLKSLMTPLDVIEVASLNYSDSGTYPPTIQSTERGKESHNRRRPLFKLELPHPRLARDDSFKAVALAGVSFMPGTPSGLDWNDSFDSIASLKPTKDRLPTPYPKAGREWIEDVDLAIREDL